MRADAQGVAGALLLGLQFETNAVMRHFRPHALGLMPDDSHDSVRGGNPFGCLNHVLQQAGSAGAMQDLGLPRTHAGAQTCSQDHYGNGGFRHGCSKLLPPLRFYEGGGP